MKKIGIRQRVDELGTAQELRDGLDHKLNEFIIKSGCLPIPIPDLFFTINSAEQSNRLLNDWLQVLALDGFVLSGGHDADKTDSNNRLELTILDYAFDHQLPVLGIGHAMEVMALWADVPLIQAENQATISFKNTEEQQPVNSAQSFSIAQCPEHFKVLATNQDKCIERITHERLPWEGWMWHPEREDEFIDQDVKNFSQLMSTDPSSIYNTRTC